MTDEERKRHRELNDSLRNILEELKRMNERMNQLNERLNDLDGSSLYERILQETS